MRELFLSKQGEILKAFLVEERQLVEYQVAPESGAYRLGDIFLGQVTRVIQGLNAAFVQVGLVREGFLHYSDLGWSLPAQRAYLDALRAGKPPPAELPMPQSPFPKEGDIRDLLRPGDWILVQVVKEMSDTKGPRLSAQLALTGQGLILLPFSPEVGVSQRIFDPALRQQWRERLQTFLRPPYGVILRTQGQYLPLSALQAEYERLIQKWESLLKRLERRAPPLRLSEASSPLQPLLQGYLSPPPDRIHSQDPILHQELQEYLRQHPLAVPPALRLHKPRDTNNPFHDLEKTARLLLGRTVTLPNGSYIVIEHTEALHVIDINSGSVAAQGGHPEEIALQTNLLAAEEIARQLRLRDLGGIIVVDFIDMRSPENRKLVYERLRDAMQPDKAKHSVLPMSEFGLVQITRQRRRPPIELLEEVPCPVCQGTGRVSDTNAFLDRIATQLRFWGEKYPRAALALKVHPLLLTHWQGHSQKTFWHWNLLPHRWLRLEADPQLPFGQALLYLEDKLVATLG